jgi:hypothetical protein
MGQDYPKADLVKYGSSYLIKGMVVEARFQNTKSISQDTGIGLCRRTDKR